MLRRSSRASTTVPVRPVADARERPIRGCSKVPANTLGITSTLCITMTLANLHLELHDELVFACADGKGWAALDRVAPGGSLHDIPYARMIAFGNGSHAVDIDLRTPSREVRLPSKGADQDAVDWITFRLFEERVGCATRGDVQSSIIWAFTPRTAEKIAGLLATPHVDALREYARAIPRTWVMRRLRPMMWWVAHSSAKPQPLPEENMRALRRFFC